ncbi:hypothetical protein ACHAWF_005110, partial [Thalassiosira exigua]
YANRVSWQQVRRQVCFPRDVDADEEGSEETARTSHLRDCPAKLSYVLGDVEGEGGREGRFDGGAEGKGDGGDGSGEEDAGGALLEDADEDAEGEARGDATDDSGLAWDAGGGASGDVDFGEEEEEEEEEEEGAEEEDDGDVGRRSEAGDGRRERAADAAKERPSAERDDGPRTRGDAAGRDGGSSRVGRAAAEESGKASDDGGDVARGSSEEADGDVGADRTAERAPEPAPRPVAGAAPLRSEGVPPPSPPPEIPSSALFATVDALYREADADVVTVKDVIRSVAISFGWAKADRATKKRIKERLRELVAGDGEVRAAGGPREEAAPDGARLEGVGDDPGGVDRAPPGEEAGAGGGRESGRGEGGGAPDGDGRPSAGSEASATPGADRREAAEDDYSACGTSLFRNLSPAPSVKSETPLDGTTMSASTSVGESLRSRTIVERGKWSLGSEIGAGSFGRVYEGMNLVDGSESHSSSSSLVVAVKWEGCEERCGIGEARREL